MKTKKTLSNLISSVMLLLTVILSVAIYVNNVNAELNNATVTTLNELASQQNVFFEREINDQLDLLNEVGDTAVEMGFGVSVELDEQELSDFIAFCEENSALSDIYIAQNNGIAYTATGVLYDVSDFYDYYEIIENDVYVGDLDLSEEEDGSKVKIATSITDKVGNRIGVVIGNLSASRFDDLLVSTYDGNGYALLFDSKGVTIGATDNSTVQDGESFFDRLSQLDFENNIASEGLDELLSVGQRSNLKYEIDGVQRELAFEPLENSDWHLAVSVPSDIIASEANNVLIHTFLLFIEFVVIAIIVFVRFRLIEKKHRLLTEKIAFYDELTGLPNLKKLKIDMEYALKKNPDTQYVIMKFDIINFNVINKLFSFEVGDEVLGLVGEFGRLETSEGHVFARVATDEFLLFGTHKDFTNTKKRREQYEKIFKDRIPIIASYDIKFRYSRYQIPLGATDINEIIDNITLTHNFAKNQKSNEVFDFDEKIKAQILHNTYICSIMHEALENEEFVVYLQPKNNLDNLSVCGAEALVRWKRPDGTFIFPNDFIPIFEQDGFIVELDKYMLRNTTKIIKRFIDEGFPPIPVSINFSRLHMLNENFVDEVTQIVDEIGVPRKLIEIEITETAILEDEKLFANLFAELHNRGFTLSMDDFGAGYSSFQTLQNLEFDVIKLDRSLLESENIERRNFVIETIIDMASKLNIKTVCEGVETIEQVEFLNSINCDIAQGYYFSKPIPNEQFSELLEKN